MAQRYFNSVAVEQQRQAELVDSPWSPLRQQLFRALWIASLASNVGSWMHEAGAGWLMASLTSSPVLIALMQTATSLPAFVLALPAGALADVVNRRKMLLFTQGWMFIVAASLAALTFFNLTSPVILLMLTFAIGAGAAMNSPAWQATTPELVPRPELPSAIALMGLGLNVGRAVGPALGGILLALYGAETVFLLNALSFVSVIWVLYRWRHQPRSQRRLRERVPNAIRAGIRYARYAPPLQAVFIRTVFLIPFSSALWALLPVLTRYKLGLGAVEYGLLFGSIGAGGMVGAIALPRLQRRFSVDLLMLFSAVVIAITYVIFAEVDHFALLIAVTACAGAGWITSAASLNLALQTAVPSWVRARAVAIYLLVFQSSMAVGSLIWGALAEHFGVAVAFWCAAIGMAAGLSIIDRYRLNGSEQLDLTPSAHWPEPSMLIKARPDDGPVLVTVEYRIDPAEARNFTAAMQPVRLQRLRDGALRANLYADPSDPARYIETFVVDSWAEHLRQHQRVTVTDRRAEEQALAFHVGDQPPAMSHFISAQSSEIAQID